MTDPKRTHFIAHLPGKTDRIALEHPELKLSIDEHRYLVLDMRDGNVIRSTCPVPDGDCWLSATVGPYADGFAARFMYAPDNDNPGQWRSLGDQVGIPVS